MSDSSRVESTQAATEARAAVVSRPRGSRAGAIDAALRRYLAAETYDQERKARRESAGEADEAGEAGEAGHTAT